MDSKSNATQGPPKATQGPAKARQRERKHSAVTSGRRLFAIDGDPSSPWARRYRDLCAGHVSDLGGPDSGPSEAQLSLVKRASTVEVELEAMEGRLSRGEAIDLDLYTRALGHLRRVLETLGIERMARPVESLHEYLARKYPDDSPAKPQRRPYSAPTLDLPRDTRNNAPEAP
jgi:hypothetical protein